MNIVLICEHPSESQVSAQEMEKKDPENSWEIIFHFAKISCIHAS